MSLIVRAPATSANLGPGFDCLGCALDLWNEVVAEPLVGAAAEDRLRKWPDPQNFIEVGACAVFDTLGLARVPFDLRCTNRIPFSRGLGSSAAAIACGVLLANKHLGTPLDENGVLAVATRVEGHPDNVTPCLLGGIRAAITRESDGSLLQVPISTPLALRFVLFVPEQGLSTEKARAALPASVPFADAVVNASHAAVLVAALASGDVAALAEATRDRLHQPYRAPLFPAGLLLADAAVQAGARASYISGAGPTVAALYLEGDPLDRVTEAFRLTAANQQVAGSILDVPISSRGAHVV